MQSVYECSYHEVAAKTPGEIQCKEQEVARKQPGETQCIIIEEKQTPGIQEKKKCTCQGAEKDRSTVQTCK